MQKEKIILDCDPGHDDAVAIMLAAINPKIELLGITVVAGNQKLEKTYKYKKKLPNKDYFFSFLFTFAFSKKHLQILNCYGY